MRLLSRICWVLISEWELIGCQVLEIEGFSKENIHGAGSRVGAGPFGQYHALVLEGVRNEGYPCEIVASTKHIQPVWQI